MENIRNFCITSHVDHGKSTLADRFLEITETVPKDKMKEQFLEMMDLEREKGITIKMRPVRMNYVLGSVSYDLNLIDTPGHVDFSYEVSRSFAAVEGAILLVDATKGIQAQTISNLEMAKKQGLTIIPAINKIDSAQARTEEVRDSLSELLSCSKEDISLVSGRTGQNVKELLERMIKTVPCPKGDSQKPFRALVFDSKFDPFKGIVAFVRVIDGSIKSGEKIYLFQTKSASEVKEIGYFRPELKPCEELKSGEIGYIATGIKEMGKVRVGDTITKFSVIQNPSLSVEPLLGYKEPKPVVFASIYPENPDDFDTLKDALAKLKLNDASFTFEQETKEALGRGFGCGFLGSLHTEIVSERLKREFGLSLIISTPSVAFKIVNQRDKESIIFSASDWPDPSEIKEVKEPWSRLEIISPSQYLGRIMEIVQELRGHHVETKYFSSNVMFLVYEVPLKEIISGFYDKLKGASQGFASMNYEILGYEAADLVKMDILIAGEKEEAFSRVVYRDAAQKEGRKIVERLKEVLPPQLFSVALQAVISGQIVARETISAQRRDVIAPLYGGDYTRKKKLLERQKKGKKELKAKGQVRIPAKVFLEMFKG